MTYKIITSIIVMPIINDLFTIKKQYKLENVKMSITYTNGNNSLQQIQLFQALSYHLYVLTN